MPISRDFLAEEGAGMARRHPIYMGLRDQSPDRMRQGWRRSSGGPTGAGAFLLTAGSSTAGIPPFPIPVCPCQSKPHTVTVTGTSRLPKPLCQCTQGGRRQRNQMPPGQPLTRVWWVGCGGCQHP